MWLYTLAEFTCIRDAYLQTDITNTKERTISRFYRGSCVADGLRLLKRYTSAHNNKRVHGLRRFIIEYRLISVCEIVELAEYALTDLDCLEISERDVKEVENG